MKYGQSIAKVWEKRNIDRIQDGSMNTGQKKILAGDFQSGFFSFVSGKC